MILEEEENDIVRLPAPRVPRRASASSRKKLTINKVQKSASCGVIVENGFEIIQLVVRVIGVAVGGSKTAMKAIMKSQGMLQQALSTMSLSMSSSPYPKGEKRVIRVYQSEPYKPTGRPPRYAICPICCSLKLIFSFKVIILDWCIRQKCFQQMNFKAYAPLWMQIKPKTCSIGIY